MALQEQLEISPSGGDYAMMRNRLTNIARAMNASPDRTCDLVLAASEAYTNALRHGCEQRVRLSIEADTEKVVVHVRQDQAIPIHEVYRYRGLNGDQSADHISLHQGVNTMIAILGEENVTFSDYCVTLTLRLN